MNNGKCHRVRLSLRAARISAATSDRDKCVSRGAAASGNHTFGDVVMCPSLAQYAKAADRVPSSRRTVELAIGTVWYSTGLVPRDALLGYPAGYIASACFTAHVGYKHIAPELSQGFDSPADPLGRGCCWHMFLRIDCQHLAACNPVRSQRAARCRALPRRPFQQELRQQALGAQPGLRQAGLLPFPFPPILAPPDRPAPRDRPWVTAQERDEGWTPQMKPPLAWP